LPIMVMNPEIRSLEVLFKYGLEPEIYCFELLERILKHKKNYNGLPDGNHFKVHIKIDTGMHRLGFQVSEIEKLVTLINSDPSIRVASVFSHLAASDDPNHDDFTFQQISVFENACNTLKQGFGYEFMRHICNSAATIRFPQAQFDAVRLGIGLYGISPLPEMDGLLKNVSTFRSVVSQVKKVAKGQSVGYNRDAVAKSEMEIAIVPVGYADGFSRSLSGGRGKLLIKGKLVPTVGNISMDMCAIDVTGLDVKPGDQVTIFGEELPITTLAHWQNTIPYEILTSVSQRVKRVYFRE
jgi:alanine racemase